MDRRSVDPEDWLVFENTHEPIIDQELWDKAQKSLIKKNLKVQESMLTYFLVMNVLKE